MTRNALLFLLIIILYACDTSSYDQNVKSGELEALVDDLCDPDFDGIAPGTAIAVVKDGEMVISKNYGYANLEHELPITENSRFDLASVSKQFAGYAIATLVEQGKISLDDDIREYIPELNEFDYTITIDHLVHHTSGIRDWTSTLPLSGRTFDDVISFDHILRMAYRQKELNFEPGDQYVYSNTGYNLLAELVQRVSGVSFKEWTKSNIYKPLGMDASLFLEDYTEVIPNRVTGYRSGNSDQFKAAPNLLTALGSSSMYSTASDLAKWATHLIEGINSGDPVITRMITKGILNNGDENTYAFGLGINEYRGTPWISHSGSWASFRTYLVVLPEYELSIIILNNYGRNNSHGIAREIAGHFVPEESNEEAGESDEDENSEDVEVATTTLDEYVGTYKLGDTWYVTITREDDQLWTQATGEDNFPMTALSDNNFLIPAYSNRTMTFFKRGDGEVSHLVYMDEERPKMKGTFTYDPKDNQDFVGQYYSEELNTYFSVADVNGELKLNHFDHGEISMSPAWKDDFRGGMWWISSVVFKRNGSGEVTGFRTSNYRARNQWFEKLY